MSKDGLDTSAEGAVGEVLHVTTSYGWGWSNPDRRDPRPVRDFDIRLDSLWHFQGIRRGGIGEIVSQGHPLFGSWVVFSTRHQKPYDFVERLGPYNVSIGHAKPTPNDKGWPIFREGSTHDGFGEVRLVNR